ncbi:hypothetical protein AAVH_35360 [Aphelenchoides avenae]|nr:hypothetical protein AAVH_35360 [Aphelenchus avenae]
MPGFKQALRRFWTCTRPDLRKLTPNGVDYNGNTHLPHMGAKKSASYMPTHAMPPKKYSTTSARHDSRHRPYLYLPETFMGKSHPPLINCRRLYRYSTQEEDPGTENDYPQKHHERDESDLPFLTTWRQVI